MIEFVRCQPCQDESADQELSSYKVDMLCEYEVELTVEKADYDAQYKRGNVMRPMLVSGRDFTFKFTLL